MIAALFQLAVAGAAAVGAVDADLRPTAPGVIELGERLVEVMRYDGTRAEIEIETPAVASADIDVDGRLDDLAWGQAALLEGFLCVSTFRG